MRRGGKSLVLKIERIVYYCLIAFLLLTVSQIWLLSHAAPPEEVTIVGIVTEGGIATYDGQLYAVVEDTMGKELMKLVGKKVEVIGVIIERGDGKRGIQVIKYGISE